jgi:hypothetical protein
MARGWESKNIEAQQEAATSARPSGPEPTADERARRERRQALALTRTRMTAQLTRATVPAHRTMLEQALSAIESELAKLD